MKDWIWWIRRWDLFWAMKKGPPGCWYFSGCFILASYVLDYFKKIYKDPYEKHAVSSQAISFCCFFRFSTVSNHPGSRVFFVDVTCQWFTKSLAPGNSRFNMLFIESSSCVFLGDKPVVRYDMNVFRAFCVHCYYCIYGLFFVKIGYVLRWKKPLTPSTWLSSILPMNPWKG